MKKLLLAMVLTAFAGMASAADVTNTAVADSASGSAAIAVAESDGVSASEGSTVVGDGATYSTYRASDMGDMVGAAIAPALTTTLTETCMGSTSIGAGWSGGGVSFGTTWRDSACVRRLDARELKNIHPNFAIAAKEMMCDSDKVYAAFKRAGMPCVVQEDKEPKKAQTATKAQPTSTAQPKNTNVSSTGNGFF